MSKTCSPEIFCMSLADNRVQVPDEGQFGVQVTHPGRKNQGLGLSVTRDFPLV